MVDLMTLNLRRLQRGAQITQQRLQLRQRADTPLLTHPIKDQPAATFKHGQPRHDELRLVWRSLRGDADATDQITSLLGQELEAIWSTRAWRASAKQEREQLLGQLLPLLFGASNRQGKLIEYQGQGELRLWLRIVALRHIIKTTR